MGATPAQLAGDAVVKVIVGALRAEGRRAADVTLTRNLASHR